MPRLGLALSGGGLRATLFHLGVVRFLRDAGLLRDVTHVVSVSGGSILGAHLALNWEQYNGSPAELEAAASKILDFVHFDARNHIARRIPFLVPLRFLQRLTLRGASRTFTETGLLWTSPRMASAELTVIRRARTHPGADGRSNDSKKT
jgi:predicted acylesterase/phospholipase RssA